MKTGGQGSHLIPHLMVEWPTIEGHGNAPIEAFLHASKDSTSRRMNYSTQGRYWNSSVEAPEDPRQNPESPMLGAEPRLEFSDEARNQLPALIPKFITEISHSLATLQEFVESTTISATGTTLTNQNLMSVLTLCSDLIRTMASQVDGFENSIKHGASRQLLKAKDLFSPGDFNQQIADVLSIQAARKDVEVVVRNPYDSFLSAGYDFHLMFYDQDFLRQLLLHVFTGVIRNSLPGSVVHQNFFFSDIQTDNDLNPTMDRMLATAMQLRLEAVFQIKYYSIVDLETSPVDANSFYLKKLEDLGGSVKKWAEGDVHIEEIHVRCQGIPFANISRLLKYFEPISQFPYALNELISFTRKLAGYKVVLHSSKSSAFLDNMSSFLRAWGADVTVIALSKELEILYEISQADKRCAQDKEDPHTRHVLITDELEHLSALLRQFMGFSRLDHLILFTSILDFESVKVKVEITYTQMEKRAPHMLVMTKPCGPERLLFALRCSEEGRQDSVARPLSVRTNSEIDEFPKLRKTLETLPRRSETLFGDADLSQFVTILLVEGRD